MKVEVIDVSFSKRHAYVKIAHPLAVNKPVLIFTLSDYERIKDEEKLPKVKYIKFKDGSVARVTRVKEGWGSWWELVKGPRKVEKS